MRYLLYFIPISYLLTLFPITIQAQVEVPSQRNINTKVFELDNGQMQAQISGQAIHYFQAGQWLDINPNLQYNNQQDVYQNHTNIFKSSFVKQLIKESKQRVEIQDNSFIELSSYKKLVHLDNNQLTVLAEALVSDTIEAVHQDHQISYPAIYPDVDLIHTIGAGQLKQELMLHSVPTSIQNLQSGWYGYQEILHLPQDWSIQSSAGATQGMAYTDLFLHNAANQIVAKIPAPVFYEAYMPNADACSAINGSYRWTRLSANTIQLETLVPLSWLKDINRQYPVVLDPSLIQVSGSTGGWMSGNNLVNNPNYIFVGVCCGNLMHRGWILYNLAAIPDGSCIMDAQLELSCNGVGGTAPERVFVNDVTGAHGPYTGTNAATYADLADGTYTDFIAANTGMYPLLGLGNQANIDIKAALPSDFFQIAMHFENEPSTNWKRFVGAASSLHITYDIPTACVLLQNKLEDFSVDCQRKEVLLEWNWAFVNDLASYEIERSMDAINFEVILSLSTTTAQLNYQYTDLSPEYGTNYYRLKMFDIYGNYAYSDWVAAECAVASSQVVLQPIPAKDYLNVEFEQAIESTTRIELFNSLGAQIKQFRYETVPGFNSIRLDIKDCPPGSYLLQLKSEGQSAVRTFIKK